MNTKLIMNVSSFFLGIFGLAFLFAPEETINLLNIKIDQSYVIQLMGSAFIALGIINWMARSIVLGGIYGRAIIVGNLLNYLTGSFVLIKNASNLISIVLLCIYLIFTILFGFLLFSDPLKKYAETK